MIGRPITLLHVFGLFVPVSLVLVKHTHLGEVASLAIGLAFCMLDGAALLIFGVISTTSIILSFQDHMFYLQ